MNEFLASTAFFGLLLSAGTFELARAINRRIGREVCNPLLFSTLLCCAVLLLSGTEYETYYESGGRMLEYLLTPATICLAIPLYRQFALMKKHAGAVLAGCAAGVAAHMLGCVLMLALFELEAAEYITLLPKSITTAIGYPAISMVLIMITGLFGAVAAPKLLSLFHVTEPMAQGLAIGTSSHAAGTSRAVELGEIQGAASSLAIVVTGLLTVAAAPILAALP